jgi:hypothetical protein
LFCLDEKIEQNLIRKYFLFVVRSDPLLGEIGIRSSIHRPTVRYSDGEKELITPSRLVSSEIQTRADDIRNYNIEAFSESLYSLALQNLRGMFQIALDGMTQVTDFTGNVVDAKGAKISPELIIEMFEKLQIDFDEHGNPVFPSIMLNPKHVDDMKTMKWSEEQSNRFKQIIEAKRAKFNAKKRYRRLSIID